MLLHQYSCKLTTMKPLARGYIHQVAFFGAIGASIMLILHSHGARALISNVIYSLTLIWLYGMSTLYHCPMWSRRNYLLMRSIDHAAIFAFIAGSATPICVLGIKSESGLQLLTIMWVVSIIGMLMTIFWTQGPKWVRAFFYIVISWFAILYLPEMKYSLGMTNLWLLLIGGIIYRFTSYEYWASN